MIYLIDDTNLESINASFVLDDSYKGVLCLIKTVDELNSERCNLRSADCIMIHRTFANSNIYKEQMAELTNDGELIPFVVFSAGDSENAVFEDSNPHVVSGLKKSVFYVRLPFFLDTYKFQHLVDLRLLAYGKNFLKVKVRSLALPIFRIIAGKDGVMTTSELAGIAACPEFKELISVSNPELGISYDDLLERLEDNPILFSSFRNNINQIVNSFNQYGKNIYIWK